MGSRRLCKISFNSPSCNSWRSSIFILTFILKRIIKFMFSFFFTFPFSFFSRRTIIYIIYIHSKKSGMVRIISSSFTVKRRYWFRKFFLFSVNSIILFWICHWRCSLARHSRSFKNKRFIIYIIYILNLLHNCYFTFIFCSLIVNKRNISSDNHNRNYFCQFVYWYISILVYIISIIYVLHISRCILI